MVLTRLLLDNIEAKDSKTLGLFNLLTEEPPTVAAWLVPRLRYHPATST